jgi:phage tail sheath protein FI
LIPTKVLEYKQARGDFQNNAGSAFNSTYGALYYPWVKIFDPLRGKAIDFPPSCSVAGVYSATDISRGVHKAPAGIVDGRLKTIVGIERDVTKGEQEILNPNGINVIRNFPESGLVVWGARTVSADPEWKYVNVRRLFLFLEESIDEGTQWVVFEPNDPVLWARITRNVSAFLRIQWLEGKLVGNKPEEAFFVKCDEETNPPESVDLGRVITVIGVAPSKPAEFVIFRIMQTRPGADA